MIDKMGFTLIEMLIVVATIALLSASAFVSINPSKRLGLAKDSKRAADLLSISKAIEFYAVDNGSLPSDFDVSNISDTKKVVLCSSTGQRTCAGQTRDCLVVDDNNFLGKYLPTLPVDPDKSNASDTGYYISRGSGDAIVLGACSNYNEASDVEVTSKINMPEFAALCGDGDVDGDEVCDDNNVVTEGCGNGTLETAGTHCNSTCTATTSIATSEVCDYYTWTADCQSIIFPGSTWYTENDTGTKNCSIDCLEIYPLACAN